MKLKNRDLLNFAFGVGSLREKRLPIKLSFALKYNQDLVMPVISAFESARDELLKTDGNHEAEITKLIDEDVELNLKMIPMSELERIDTEPNFDALTLREIETISFMISEE